MRLHTLLLGSLLLAGVAQAQPVAPLTGSTGTPAGPAASPAPATVAPAAPAPSGTAAAPATRTRTRRTMAERFDAANTTHDGHLTLAQAKAGRMVAVSRDFAQIDKQHRGYVTMDDIKAFRAERRAARRAAKTTPAPAQ